MRPFRFRADAVLDLRHRQEEKAKRLLAQAQASLGAAQEREQHARAQAARAVADIESAQTAGVEAWRLEWHRNWILRQRRDAEACARSTAISAVSVAHATTTLNLARQQRRAIERLKECAKRRYDLAARRHENTEMDALAGIRFTTGLQEGE